MLNNKPQPNPPLEHIRQPEQEPTPSPNTHTMSEAYERERQNNSRLDELASKVSALRGVTIDIYDNARDQGVIDSSNEVFSNFSTSLKGSAGRLGRMAQQGNKVAILKLAGILIAFVLVLWYIGSYIFGGSKGE